MRPLKTQRALAAYSALLVLPALVLGWLYWAQLERDYRDQLAEAPQSARDAADRLIEGMRERLGALVQEESRRPISHYGEVFSPGDALGDDLALQPSPLVKERATDGVQAWFSFDRNQGLEAAIHVFYGAGRDGPEHAPFRRDVELALEGFRRRKDEEGPVRRASQIGDLISLDVPLEVAAVLTSHRDQLECLRACRHAMLGRTVSIDVSDFYLQFYLEPDGTPRAVASRRALMGLNFIGAPPGATCLDPMLDGMGLHQGFLIDVDWLLADLADDTATQTLRDADRLVHLGFSPEVDPSCEVCADVYPVRDLGFDTSQEDEGLFGQLQIAVNTELIQERFRKQKTRFAGVATMLVLSLVTGMILIQRSVRRELLESQARENFVSAVTHELRTPLAAIRLYGEMLVEGWTDDPEKVREYHRRILRETNRLTTLVERVLEKGRLTSSGAVGGTGDLNELIRALEDELQAAHPVDRPHVEGNDDLAFHLADELPRVRLSAESVAGILVNLVENARKYAPVDPGDPEAARIEVRTRFEGGRVLLEVADRGPGVPSEERELIFEAFHRVGNEATRTSTGTGLGLHLVRLHAESVGGDARVLPRPGGGSVFRVAFRPA